MSTPTSSPGAERRNRGPIAILAFTVFLDIAGFGMILPMLPFYAERYGASAFQIGLLFACYSLAQFLFSPVWGRLSDHRGRRPLLLVSIALGCASYLLFAVAQTLALLFLARTLAGAAAANYSIAQAYVADVTGPERRARGMGMLGAAFGMGFVVGPALGAGLSHWGATAVPLGAAALAAANLLLVWLRVPEPARRSGVGAASRRWWPEIEAGRSLTVLLALYGAVIFAFSTMEATLALLCEERLGFGIRETSWLFVYVGVLVALVQAGLIGRVVARWGERRVMTAGVVTMGAGLALLAGTGSLQRLLLATALLAVGSGLFQPTSFSLVSRLAPDDGQGAVLGAARSVGALARVFGPVWGGWAFMRLGSGWPFVSAALLMAVGAVLVLRMVAAGVPEPAVADLGGTR